MTARIALRDVTVRYGDHRAVDGVSFAADAGKARRLSSSSRPLCRAGRPRVIALDNAARTQLLAEAAGTPQHIRPDVAERTAERVGSEKGGILSFHPLWDKITTEEPDLLT